MAVYKLFVDMKEMLQLTSRSVEFISGTGLRFDLVSVLTVENSPYSCVNFKPTDKSN